MAPDIIDIEASGFGPRGYPIEVGVALRSGRTWCSLVQPPPDWAWWDAGAEAAHGISRELLLAHGRPLAEVARTLNELLGERVVYSDAWHVDNAWLIQLFHAARVRPAFRCSMLELILDEAQMAAWQAARDEVVRELALRRHRASNDALIVQRTWLRTRGQANGRTQGSGGSS